MSVRLGVVVFGVGIAGRVRIRDIGAMPVDDSLWKLIGFVSRRKLDIEGTTQLEEDKVWSRSDVHAIAVCSEPAGHESVVRKAIDSGKHVLVEFPLATSATATKHLYTMAQQKGVILHEENIALLTPAFLSMKDKLQNLSSSIVKTELKFTGNYNGWVEDLESSGGPFCVSVSLLQTLYELLGKDLVATWGQLEVTEDGITASAQLTCSKCRDITVTVRRQREKGAREKRLIFTLADGSVLEDSPTKPVPTGQATQTQNKPGLFMQDFLQFIDEIRHVRDPSPAIDRTLHCIQLAEHIHDFMGLKK